LLTNTVHLCAHRLFRRGGHFSDDDLRAIHINRIGQEFVADRLQIGRGSLFELSLELLDLLLQTRDAYRQFLHFAAEALGQFRKHSVFLLHDLDRLARRHASEAAYAFADRFLADDLEIADLAGVIEVRAAAELTTETVAD